MVGRMLSDASLLSCGLSDIRPGGGVRWLELWFHSLEERSGSEMQPRGILQCIGDPVNSGHGERAHEEI